MFRLASERANLMWSSCSSSCNQISTIFRDMAAKFRFPPRGLTRESLRYRVILWVHSIYWLPYWRRIVPVHHGMLYLRHHSEKMIPWDSSSRWASGRIHVRHQLPTWDHQTSHSEYRKPVSEQSCHTRSGRSMNRYRVSSAYRVRSMRFHVRSLVHSLHQKYERMHLSRSDRRTRGTYSRWERVIWET